MEPVRDWTTEDLLDAWDGRVADEPIRPPAPTMEEALLLAIEDIEDILHNVPYEPDQLPPRRRAQMGVMLDYMTYALMRHEINQRARELRRGARLAPPSIEDTRRDVEALKEESTHG